MLRCVFLCLAFCAIVTSAVSTDTNVNISVNTVDSISNYLRLNPGAKVLGTLNRSYSYAPFRQILYTLGHRVPGDRMVATSSGKKNCPTPQDVKLTIAYPNTGLGAVVSYVEVAVAQSSRLGHGYVVDGGIGQRHIVIVVEVSHTNYFEYKSKVFGY